ncbi:MAG TPA: kelch repeat-containing protein [Candidatus Sulfotelmatobacter sp.]|nr:kelch repeat-containing protein [Candidatus Sulfotelmatobacter sp.]
MKKLPAFFLPAACAVFLLAADQPKIPPMPAAVSGNAVASLKGGIEVYSLMGVGSKKTWDDITNKVYVLHLSSAKWSEGRPVPGVGGRLGASAVGARGQIFLFGGYLVDGQGVELTVADVNSYLPDEKRWYRAEDMPVAVDSAVIGLNQNRYIYLAGGRSKNGPVNIVQVYDAEKNTWSQATPFPGTPVFGHAGGLTDDAIVFVDGARKNTAEGSPYIASDECWLGKIDHKDPNKIAWSKLPAHPGPGRFGIVAGEKDHRVIFSGGTTAPHNFKGLDADGKPAEISPMSFDYDVRGNRWETITDDTFDVRADSRGMVSTPVGSLIVGGTLSNQALTARVLIVPKR